MFEKVRAAGGFAKGDLADHAEAERMLRDFIRWRRGMPKGGEPLPFVSKDPFGECNTAAQVLVDDAPFISQAVACDGRNFGYRAAGASHPGDARFSAVMDGQTRDASLDRFPMEHPAKAVRFPRFTVALQGLSSGPGAARMGPTFPQSIIRCYFPPSLLAQRSIRVLRDY
jgi:hypothetical protein